MTMKSVRVAVDLGGTKILAVAEGAEGPGGQFAAATKLPTGADRGGEAIFATLCAAVEEVLSSTDSNLSWLGVCVPGIVDPQSGVVMDCSNLPGWDRFPLAEKLKLRFGAPVAVENDARAACWAEATTGAGAGRKNLAFVTLSTGIGAGFVFDGRLYRGTRGVAGELGETMDDSGNPVEKRAGGRAMAQRYGFAAEELRSRHDAGDPRAYDAFAELVSVTGRLLANVATLVDPEIIVIGGGLAKLGPWYLDALQQQVRDKAYSLASQVSLVPARWSGEAGVRGMLAF